MLILVRHGNTFLPEQQAVWIGSGQDVPLQPEGIAQAQRLGEVLQPLSKRVVRVQCSPMQRTLAHAETLLRAMGSSIKPQQTELLRELNYGSFAGRSRAQLIAQGFGEELEAWETYAAFPESAHFAPPREQLMAQLDIWLNELTQISAIRPADVFVAVTHGGVLRLLFALCSRQQKTPIERPNKVIKMACGHASVVKLSATGPRLQAWNVAPDHLPQMSPGLIHG